MTPDDAWDADVFVERTWIAARAGGRSWCTALRQPRSGRSFFAPVFIGADTLAAATPDNWTHTVPAGTDRVRFALNGEQGTVNDFDFFIKFGSQASPTNFDCKGENPGVHEFCEVASPSAGTWYIHILPFAGSGDYQLSATNFVENGIFADGFESGDTTLW